MEFAYIRGGKWPRLMPRDLSSTVSIIAVIAQIERYFPQQALLPSLPALRNLITD